MEILLLVPALAVVALLVWWSHRAEQKRRATFAAWGRAHGFAYYPEQDRELARHYAFLEQLDAGHSHYVFDLFEGAWAGRAAAVFGYHYATGSGKDTIHHYRTVAVLRLERAFPELRIAPEGWFGGWAGGDIDFESAEFSRRFHVASSDKRFAYDFCHPRLMEYLLQRPDTALEIEGDAMALILDGQPELPRLQPALEHLARLRAHMPEYLFRDPALAAVRNGN